MYPVDERLNIATKRSQILEFPTEILQQIFLLVCRSSGNTPCTRSSVMILSHVCSRWRHIALGYSPLWTFFTNADFCHHRWMSTVIQRSGSCSLSINFRSSWFLDEQLEMIHSLPRVKKIFFFSDYWMVDRLLSSAKWAPDLETLQLCVGDAEDCETPMTYSVGSHYIARVNEQHLPNLPFFGDVYTLYYDQAPTLRHISLTNCCIRPAIKSSPSLERLEISHGPCGLGHFVSDWAAIIRCLPSLTFLSIDGAMTRDPSYRRTEYNLLTELPPVTQLKDLRINRCSLACASLLHIFAPQPRSLQLTFTDAHYNEEFNLFCDALQVWFRGWGADTPNTYLYVSIQPEGIIVHNRSTRQEFISTYVESSPSLQLALYWQAGYAGEKELDLISATMNLISTLEPHPDSTFYSLTSPLTRGCEELELSVGLFDYEDEALRTVITGFLSRFRDVKKLTCIGGAAAMLTLLAPEARQVGDVSLFPLLEYFCFDHVDFKDGLGKKLEHFLRSHAKLRQSVGHVALNGCHNVSQRFFTSLGRTCTKVVLGHDTVLVDDYRGNVTGTREPWTNDQAKVSSL